MDLEERDAVGAAQTIRAEVRLPPNRVMWVRFERIAAPPPEPETEPEPQPEREPQPQPEPEPEPVPDPEPEPVPEPGPEPEEPAKTMDHYLLVGAVPASKTDFLAILRYVGRFAPAVGADVTEARQASHVTILGGLSAVSAAVEQGLRENGAQVQRIATDYAATLTRLIEEGKPY